MPLDTNYRRQAHTAACTHASWVFCTQLACISRKPVAFIFQLSPPHPVSHGPSYLFLASCLQPPKRRTDERWNYLSGLHGRLSQLYSLIGKPLEFRLSLESHQEADYSYRELRWLTPALQARTAGAEAMANRGLPLRWAVEHSPAGPWPFPESM